MRPAIGGITDLETLDGLVIDAPLFQIRTCFCACICSQLLSEEGIARAHDAVIGFLSSSAALIFFGVGGLVLRKLNACACSKGLHGFDKGHAGMFGQKLDGIAGGLAAKAIIRTTVVAYAERGCALVMKRAQAFGTIATAIAR